jgi:hypothetical protein
MPAVAVAAVSSFPVICFGKNDEAFLGKIIVFLIKFIGERHRAKLH